MIAAEASPAGGADDGHSDPRPDIGDHAALSPSGNVAPDAALLLASFESEPVAEQNPPLPLTLDAAIAVSLDRNPALVALRASDPVAHAAYHVAQVYPWNPTVQVEVLPYSVDRQGNPIAVTNYVLLTQTLELAHQQRFREASASAAWSQVRWNIVHGELTTAAQTERLYFAALYQRELLDYQRQSAELDEQLLGVIERRYEATLATAAELSTARLAARHARLQVSLANASYEVAMSALRRQINLPLNQPIALDGRLEDFAWQAVGDGDDRSTFGCACPASDSLIAELSSSRPDVMAAGAAVIAARANANLARANKIPNVGVGPFYERNEAGDVFAGLRAQTNVPVWDTGNALLRQREAEIRQQAVARQQLQERAAVEAATAIERYERTREMALSEGRESAAALPDELQRLKDQFTAGQADILNVLAAQGSLIQERVAYLGILNEVAQAAADVTLDAGLLPERLFSPPRAESPAAELLPTP